MLATQWCVPGQGSTVKELLDWAPSHVIDSAEFIRLKPYLNDKTSLRLVSPEDGDTYDYTRIEEALRRMGAEPELCVVGFNKSDDSDMIEHAHFGGQAEMSHKVLLTWISDFDRVWGEEAGVLKIKDADRCHELERAIEQMEDRMRNER